MDFFNVFKKSKSQELPVPPHLSGYLVADKHSNEFKVSGTVKCPCDDTIFHVYESNQKNIVQLVCVKCEKELILFDSGKNGWNGFVCKDDSLDRNAAFLKTDCTKCGNDDFEISIMISSQGKEDFLQECAANDASFKESDWVEAFEWITVSLACEKCGYKEINWMECETM